MTILDKLATARGRKDEAPNQELAREIVQAADRAAVKELVAGLHATNRAIQSDCIKVLYEIGAVQAELIAEYTDTFLALLDHRNNRLQWGAMAALDAITQVQPDRINLYLGAILDAADRGSVISRDHAVNILIQLAGRPEYAESAFPLLIAQILHSPVNQVAMYAERTLAVIDGNNKQALANVLQSRLNDIEKDSKRKRVEKILHKLAKYTG